MKQMKLRWLSVIAVLILCFGLFACNQKPSNGWDDTKAPNNQAAAQGNLIQYVDFLKIVGRCTVVSNGISCDFTASGIEFNITVQGTVQLDIIATADTYFTVFVDHQRSATRFYAKAGISTITVADFPTKGTHHIRVLKQTEPQNSLCILNSLKFNGNFEAKPLEKDLYIEFLGDSISCGYGNLCAIDAENSGNALNQDGTQAYAFLTAAALDADSSVISCSGIGVASGYTECTMDTFFSKQSYFRSTAIAYTKTRTPDIVVINLGTNDDTRGVIPSEFMEKAKLLVSLIRETYGNVPIIWAHGMMKDGMKNQIEVVASELNNAQSPIYAVQVLESYNTNGGGGHPDLNSHVAAATCLTKFITDTILTLN